MVKISSLLIGIIIVGMVVAGLGLFMGEMQDNYGGKYNDSLITDLQAEVNNVTILTNSVQANVTEIKTKSGITDLLGDFFSSGYSALKITMSSFNIMDSIIGIASRGLGVPSFFVDGFKTIIIILIVIGVILAALLKWAV